MEVGDVHPKEEKQADVAKEEPVHRVQVEQEVDKEGISDYEEQRVGTGNAKSG